MGILAKELFFQKNCRDYRDNKGYSIGVTNSWVAVRERKSSYHSGYI